MYILKLGKHEYAATWQIDLNKGRQRAPEAIVVENGSSNMVVISQ